MGCARFVFVRCALLIAEIVWGTCTHAGIAVLTYNLMGETPEETTIVGTEGW